MTTAGTVILKSLDFGNEAGDDVDPDELLEYFVEQEAFGKFLDKRKKLLVATARKGIGKSALLKWTAFKAKEKDPNALVITVRGVVDPIFWTEKRPFLRWWAALKIEESQCPKPARVTRPA